MAWTGARKPLVGEFTVEGRPLFVIAAHFSSKAGDQPLYGRNQPPSLPSEVQRTQQAGLVQDFVAAILAVDPLARVAVLGDLNDFAYSPPLATLKGANLNALTETLPESERHTYVFQGNAQALDHILVSRGLLPKAEYDIVHINTEYVAQVSDHDPVVARLRIGPACVLDLDDDKRVDALTDGLLLLRALLGQTGDAVTAGALGAGAGRQTWNEIQPVIQPDLLDVDSDGKTDAMTDGLLILRALFGLTGTAVTDGAVGTGAGRGDWEAIRSYLNTMCGTQLAH